MQFSSRLNLACHILLYLAEYQDTQKVTSEVLSATTGVNAVNVRKTLGLLKAANLIEVRPGIGGTFLTRRPEGITLADVFDAVEDKEAPLFPMHANPNRNCPVGRSIGSVMDARVRVLEDALHSEMERMTIQQMQDDMHHLLQQENISDEKEKNHGSN
jgi:DNA-binding IscR family transcriptional regulator